MRPAGRLGFAQPAAAPEIIEWNTVSKGAQFRPPGECNGGHETKGRSARTLPPEVNSDSGKSFVFNQKIL
jgi:hypothetical protein